MTRWISVKERLPERGEVIAFSAQYNEYLLGWLAETEEEGIVCYGDGVEMYFVTHWMPLPSPPVVIAENATTTATDSKTERVHGEG